jgi:HK97 family phage portal protein
MFKKIVQFFGRSADKNPENPANSLYDDDVIDFNSASKFPKVGAIWRACSLISKATAKTPFDLFEKSASGREKVASPVSNLLLYEPNAHQTAYVFKMSMQFAAAYHGNAYAYIKRDKYFRPVELIQLDSAVTHPVRENGVVFYVTTVNGKMLKFESFEIIHVRGAGDDLVGYSVKDMAAVAFDMAEMSQKYSRNFFKNSARPSVILECPNLLSDEAAARLKKQWDTMHRGIDNSHKTAVLEEGTKVNPFSINAKDAMLIESMQFSLVDVANWFELPAYKLNSNNNTSYKSNEQQSLDYLSESLDPWFVCWEQECRKKLLTEAEKSAGKLYFEFNRASLIRVDLAAQANYFNKALAGAPWMSINEVRAKSNMNNAEGFDEIKMPSNNFGEPQKPAEPAPEPGAAEEAARAAISHVQSRMVDRLEKDLKGATDIPARIAERHADIIRRELEPVCKVYLAITGKDVSESAYQEIVNKYEVNHE